MEPKRRNRAKKPAWSFSGLDLERWKADSERVRWAQSDPTFRDVLTVVVNERRLALTQQPGTTENYQLGLVRGFELAVSVLLGMQGGQTTMPGPMGDPEYQQE